MKSLKVKPPVVLKLGGSVVTFKDRLETPRLDVIRRLALEIAEAKPESLILVHGGGGFGHPHALTHRLMEGFKGGLSQLVGFSETRLAMARLNSLMVEALNRVGIPALGFQTSALVTAREGRISSLNLKPLSGALRLGGVPVIYGDAVIDEVQGFTIVSGDMLSSVLARRFRSPLLALGVDVDGIYTDDPKLNPEAKLIRRIKVGRGLKGVLIGVEGSRSLDVTGGMKHKLLEVKRYVASGGKALIFNALKAGNVARVLKGLEVEGTLLEN